MATAEGSDVGDDTDAKLNSGRYLELADGTLVSFCNRELLPTLES